jgi:hypothetical protein
MMIPENQPAMTTVGNRPTPVLNKLDTSIGIYILCRLSDGQDAYVPLKEILSLLKKELISEIQRGF